ncbi:MAG TPA: hydrogenase maturation protease [bacterium]|jgi:hydrogenase maturation protease
MSETGGGLIVCVGNSLAGDDRAGCAVHDMLSRANLPGSVTLLRLDLAGLGLLDHLKGQHLLLIVDAVQLGKPPGTVHVLDWDEIPPSSGAVSIHGIGIREAMGIAGELFADQLPQCTRLIGIEGRSFSELGAEMTAPVAAAIPRAVEEIEKQLKLAGLHDEAL